MVRPFFGACCKDRLDVHLHPLGRRLQVANSRDGLKRLKRQLSGLAVELVVMEIARRIAGDPGLARRYAVVASIPGVGPVAAATLIVGLSELGMCSSKAAALLAGLAPIAADSGERSGERHIRGGRAPVRCALYMAALTASRCNHDLAAIYRRLRAAGKKPKVALTAVM